MDVKAAQFINKCVLTMVETVRNNESRNDLPQDRTVNKAGALFITCSNNIKDGLYLYILQLLI